jgi:hypothetical protein
MGRGNQTGNNTLALVNVKISEGLRIIGRFRRVSNDVIKLGETQHWESIFRTLKPGTGPRGIKMDLMNVGINFNGKIGPVALKAQFDQNMGDETLGVKQDFKGNEIVVQVRSACTCYLTLRLRWVPAILQRCHVVPRTS